MTDSVKAKMKFKQQILEILNNNFKAEKSRKSLQIQKQPINKTNNTYTDMTHPNQNTQCNTRKLKDLIASTCQKHDNKHQF